MPASGWKDVAVRTWQESSDENVGLVAAGVAFYGFLPLVPLLGAIVITYGFVAEPQTVVSHLEALTKVLPQQVAGVIGEMLLTAVKIGMILSILSIAGRALLRRRGKEGLGAAALVTAAGLTLARRERADFPVRR